MLKIRGFRRNQLKIENSWQSQAAKPSGKLKMKKTILDYSDPDRSFTLSGLSGTTCQATELLTGLVGQFKTSFLPDFITKQPK